MDQLTNTNLQEKNNFVRSSELERVQPPPGITQTVLEAPPARGIHTGHCCREGRSSCTLHTEAVVVLAKEFLLLTKKNYFNLKKRQK